MLIGHWDMPLLSAASLWAGPDHFVQISHALLLQPILDSIPARRCIACISMHVPVITHAFVVAHSPVVADAAVMAHPPVTVDTVVVTPPTWPTETDIIFLPGSNKLLLTVQHPIMHLVIQEAIKWTRANIMCGNVFPNAIDILKYIKDAFLAAADENHQAVDICCYIVVNHVYFIKMSHLMSSSI